jgi:polyisoprenoid-binding protein YceI
MRHTHLILFISILCISFSGCTAPSDATAAKPQNKSVQKQVPVTKSVPAKKLTVPSDAIALTGAVAFVGRKVIGSHDFEFKKWTGFTQLKNGGIAGGQIAFEIQTESVVADENNRNQWTPKLEKHMKDPDFFDVKKYPTATFSSETISPLVDGGPNRFIVTGLLTIKGISKKVSFPATVTQANGAISAQAQVTINRQDFKIAYPGKPDNLIQDEVVLTIKVRS